MSFKKNLVVFSVVIVVFLGIYATVITNRYIDASASIALSAKTERLAKEKEEEDLRLGQYSINMMLHTTAGTKLSDAKKQTLARSIVRVANEIFETADQKKAFVAVLAIESGFQRTAQSPTGPRGYTQVAKKTFMEGLEKCGVASAKDEDVWETDINLYAGACYFRDMLEKSNNDPFIAIVAYNQGPNADVVKQYAKNGTMDQMEPLKYVAKFNFLREKVPTEKPDGVLPFSGEAKSGTTTKLPLVAK